MAWRPGTYAVLGMAAAAFAYCATLRLLLLQDSEQQPEQCETADCTLTAAEAMEMCAYTMVLLLWGAAQALVAVTAVAATRRVSTVLAQLLSLSNAWILAGVADLLAGRCLGDGIYHQELFIGGLIIAPFR